jgi:flavin-dependent dehydrogenase
MVYLPNTKSIQIAGGGIAGLTAAIQLKRSKFHPVVFEKESRIGNKRHGDYEGLDNWIFTNKMSSFFSQIGFDFNQIQFD